MTFRTSIAGWGIIGTLGMLACEADTQRYNSGGSDLDVPLLLGGPAVAASGPCSEGEIRDCSVTLAEHAGIVSCFHGVQLCTDGVFGPCEGDTYTEQPVVKAWGKPGKGLFAASLSEGCADNPCDPYCQRFDIIPDEPLVAEGVGPGFSWETGEVNDPDVSSSMSGLVPCMSGSDCQFNQACINVATSAESAHSKCEEGVALVAGSDECVAKVCEANAECCQRGWNCAHDVCETGVSLSASCDNENPSGESCVNAVCSAHSECCSGTWSGSCVGWAASLCGLDCGSCAPGETASVDGSSCYILNTNEQEWTDARESCQNYKPGWDIVEIESPTENGLVKDLIGNRDIWLGLRCSAGSCNSTPPWGWPTGSNTYRQWGGTSEPNEGGGDACARMRTANGDSGWYDKPCTDDYHSVCEGPPSGGNTQPAWTGDCVDLVASQCDATCSVESPLSELGQCVSWQPGTTDPAAPDVADLALGIPCGSRTVPICNHGGVAAPVGVTVDYYSSASNQYPACSPEPSLVKGSCDATTVEIPPGECVNVVCSAVGASALADGDTLVVNPTGAIPEYSCLDNWTMFSDGVTCGEPSCATSSSEAVFSPVRMLIMVDRSYSMYGNRWTGTVNALTSFFESADSAGIGVALDFFPVPAGFPGGDGCAPYTYGRPGSTSCDAVPCSNPMVELDYLTADPLDTHETALVAALPGQPAFRNSISTPALPALIGALQWAKEQQAEKPDETFVVVFVTDGVPSSCLVGAADSGDPTATNTALADLAESVFSSTGVRTYTIGLEGAEIAALNSIAAAGGTEQAFVISDANSSGIASEFNDALVAISLQGASCSFALETTDESNPAGAKVVYSSGPTDIVMIHRDSLADCGGGWYFDDNDDPKVVNLCPSSCDTVQSDPNASVTVDIPCSPKLEPSTSTQLYSAECGDSQSPLWQFLNYATDTPVGASVDFKVRTAATAAELATAEYVLVSTATDIQPNCGPSALPICLVDLVDLADVNDELSATESLLELEITVNPSSDGQTPVVDTWQVYYSCVFDE